MRKMSEWNIWEKKKKGIRCTFFNWTVLWQSMVVQFKPLFSFHWRQLALSK